MGICGYRHCELESGNKIYCHPEHRRREKLFRLGKVSDLSYFRKSDPVLGAENVQRRNRTCIVCSDSFILSQSEKNNNRCRKCRGRAREKICKKCGAEFRDKSKKNTRRYCLDCKNSPTRKIRKSDSSTNSSVSDFSTLKPFTNTWWGRLGEKIFNVFCPDSLDVVSTYGNASPYDADSLSYGRVDVKTSQASKNNGGKDTWSFQISGVTNNSDHAFLIAFSKDPIVISYIWLVPSKELPETLKVMTPGSCEYEGSEYELSQETISILNRHLKCLLSESLSTNPQTSRKATEVPYERTLLGRIGERFYAHLNPQSVHVALNNPTAKHDFLDPDGSKINVRARRPYVKNGRDRWTFFRTESCDADVYHFLGLDFSGTKVEKVLRVPSSEMPVKGFSLSRNSENSKWLQYAISLGDATSFSEFAEIEKFERLRLVVTAPLTTDLVANFSEVEVSNLVTQALDYYRVVGFPYPGVPSDNRVLGSIRKIRESQADVVNRILPVNNFGLGYCSAYMPHRFSCKNESSDFSALGAFHNDKRFKRALRFSLRGKSPSLRGRAVRSSLTALNRTPTQFKPSVAHFLCSEYCSPGGLVFDPCAGWGGRLLGALVAGCRYLGVDLSSQTCEGLYRIGSRSVDLLSLGRDFFQIVNSDILKLERESNSVDFVLTSPPYWDQEEYKDSQSFESVEVWVSKFLKPMVEKVFSFLKEGGHFAININDIKRGRDTIPLISITKDVFLECGLSYVDCWHMRKGSFGNQRANRTEPVMVFRKG